MTDLVFSVQDNTGTVYQLETLPSPGAAVAVGDAGIFSGVPDNGTDAKNLPASVDQACIVTQVLDATHFSITATPDTLLTGWPRSGVINWTSGANVGTPTDISHIEAANAYITVIELKRYLASRGYDTTASDALLQTSIVQATDYLDQRYSYKGVKLVQKFGSNISALNGVFVEPWLTPTVWGVAGVNVLVPSTTPQATQWPRQGVVDTSGDSVNGIPGALKAACAELAYRASTGTKLQPDFDPSIVTAGGVVSSKLERVGPIERQTTYDTKLALGFFPAIPQVTRILAKAGLLASNGGGRVVR